MPLAPHGDIHADTEISDEEILSLGGTHLAVLFVLLDYSDLFVPKIMVPEIIGLLVYLRQLLHFLYCR